MIKFFRKIRQKLLSENKFSKYLIYAIGEIVLVIIGILIALGINENVKDKNNLELRDLYIIQLNDEVNQNIKQLNNLENETSELIKDVDTLIRLLVNKEYDNPKLASKSQILIMANDFHPIMITYENLKSSGDLKLFDDLNVRNSISESYETFNEIKTVELIDNKGVEIYYENFLIPNVSFWDMNTNPKSYAKETYFQNMVLARSVSLRQNRDAYEKSIESLTKLKTTFNELHNDN
ncbi:hypothetical protein [Winogradskyella sp. A2]|uniref:hypothetical protein n=1 Tax=Winogradskyella sp. A2 TaxID=3366944 RepID=UPI00398C6002